MRISTGLDAKHPSREGVPGINHIIPLQRFNKDRNQRNAHKIRNPFPILTNNEHSPLLSFAVVNFTELLLLLLPPG